MRLRAACVQYCASGDLNANLDTAETLILEAVKKKADFIALPENFAWRGKSAQVLSVARQSARIIKNFQILAREKKAAILLGSLLEAAPSSRKAYNTSVFISEKGKVTKYQKIHLFKIGLKKVRTDETKNVLPGKNLRLAHWGPFKIGLTICYDLRFPELYRALTKRGAQMITVPSNFTEVTGRAHWETLLKARAVENQVFVIAPAQTGEKPVNGLRSFGTSLIVDPWGKVLAKGSQKRSQVILADLDFSFQKRLRSQFPVLTHRVLS